MKTWQDIVTAALVAANAAIAILYLTAPPVTKWDIATAALNLTTGTILFLFWNRFKRSEGKGF